MELISSVEAEVSSSDAACSDDPCASDWLEEETCKAALATCSAPSPNSPAKRRSALLTARTAQAATPPTARHTVSRTKATQRLWEDVAAPSFSASARWSL